MRKYVVATVLLLFGASALFYAFFVRGGEEPLNVVLITVDTLVPGRLGYEGAERNTSPALDRLASEGVVFENCYSVAGWTLPAVASILTGRYPMDHGATDFHWSMDDELPTMASILRSKGYDTMGYVSHVVLKPVFGIAKGFRSYDYSVLNYGHPHDVSTAGQLTDLVIDGLRKAEEPFFLWVHYFDPHFMYLPHEGWERFGDSDIDRYDQEIAFTDSRISRLITFLERRGLYDRSVIVFTSDHGEEFGEHGGVFHYTLHEEVMRVPLIIRVPGGEHRVVKKRAEQIDILPTVLSALGLDASAFPGRNLLGDFDEKPVFMERDRPPPYTQRAVMDGPLKLVVIELADTSRIPEESKGTFVKVTNVHPGLYLYDLSRDPGEKVNIYDSTSTDARRLLALMTKHFSAGKALVREVSRDEKLDAKLRSLGYIK